MSVTEPATRLTQECLYRPWDVDLREAQVSALRPFVGFVWLVAEYSFNARYKKRAHQDKNRQLGHNKKKDTTPDCPATMVRGPGTTPLSRARNCTNLSCYNSPWTSGQSAAHRAVHHRPRPTGGLLTTQQPCSPPAGNTAGESPLTYTN